MGVVPRHGNEPPVRDIGLAYRPGLPVCLRLDAIRRQAIPRAHADSARAKNRLAASAGDCLRLRPRQRLRTTRATRAGNGLRLHARFAVQHQTGGQPAFSARHGGGPESESIEFPRHGILAELPCGRRIAVGPTPRPAPNQPNRLAHGEPATTTGGSCGPARPLAVLGGRSKSARPLGKPSGDSPNRLLRGSPLPARCLRDALQRDLGGIIAATRKLAAAIAVLEPGEGSCAGLGHRHSGSRHPPPPCPSYCSPPAACWR